MSTSVALVRLQLRKLGERPGMRAARLYSLGIFLSFGLLVLLTREPGPNELTGLCVAALESASWVVAGLATWASAGPLAEEDQHDGLALLVGMHGVSPRRLAATRTFSAALRSTLSIAAPALGVALLGALKSGRLAWAGALAALSVAYALSLGVTLSLLARGLQQLFGGRARLALLLLLLGPELLRLAEPNMPSASALFGDALENIAALGKAFS
ncbi:MAG: hypothetical protein QM756_29355 [Polyangiaceae bacterium]